MLSRSVRTTIRSPPVSVSLGVHNVRRQLRLVQILRPPAGPRSLRPFGIFQSTAFVRRRKATPTIAGRASNLAEVYFCVRVGQARTGLE